MTTRPTVPTDWADAVGANRSTVPTAIRDLGVPQGDVFRSAYYNEALHDAGLWLTFLKDFAPAESTLSVGRIVTGGDPLTSIGLMITDDGGASGGINVVVTQDGYRAFFGSAGAYVSFDVTDDIATARAIGGWGWYPGTVQTGIVAGYGFGINRLFAFDVAETMAIDISPASGGWTFQRATSGTALGYASGSGGASSPFVGSSAVRLNDSQNTGDCWRRPLVEVEPSASRAGTVWHASGMGLKTIVAATGPVRIRVGQRNRATGSESAFGSFVVQSNTTPTGSHLFTYAPGSPEALDLETYSYFLEMDVTDLNASSQAIERAYLTLTKSAAD